MNTNHRLPSTVGLVVLLSLVAAACSVAPGGSTSGTGNPQRPATNAIAPDGVDCLTMAVETGSVGSIASLRRDATSVVVGTFGGYGNARWTTPDGHRPTREEFQSGPARLVRPLGIGVNGQIKGARTAAARAVQRGGTTGCDSVTYGNELALHEGQRYVFFLVPLRDSLENVTEDYLLLDAFQVGPGDRVTTPADGTFSMADFTDAVLHGPKETVPPSPGEPESSGPG
jgi:hypothetical protein